MRAIPHLFSRFCVSSSRSIEPIIHLILRHLKFLRSLYLDTRFFAALGVVIVLLILGEYWPVFLGLGKAGIIALGLLTLFDLLLLYRVSDGMRAVRDMAERLSNGDENEIRVYVRSRYAFPVSVILIDEIPHQFQVRNAHYVLRLPAGSERIVRYTLRPTRRGEYEFGKINLYARSPIRFVQRRYQFAQEGETVPVYPSYIQMRRYELMAHSNRLAELGIKKIRRVGQTMEFDQIREYVVGDDYRRVNWKATARRGGQLMVNQYQDERSQRVYSLIDKGRVMKMPFEEMTLLDYAINASLVLSNIAVVKQDRAGLITFSKSVQDILPAERTRLQMHRIVETLYNQETEFPETDFERLYTMIRRKITTRSLLFLFTNFETLAGLERQLPYLRRIARLHLLVVVFFENTELRELLAGKPQTTEEITIKTIGEQFAWEKRQIVKELDRHGILSIYTSPQGLTANTINKYLEVKARRLV
ncbi:MAG: DUF58 domain-containing protein [Ignavibacteriae bacterium]|nr:DUF58 domain-containing protein [Ignavibacteriota bacterium]MCB9214981.1 DUF58 domain-containing protein [Ignavibacteria bacterium]